ncbi:MAG: hypothetical protein WAL37_01340, partial [Xanthobacteraceae bacterium]
IPLKRRGESSLHCRSDANLRAPMAPFFARKHRATPSVKKTRMNFSPVGRYRRASLGGSQHLN